MSEENVDLAKRALDAYNDREVEAMIEVLDPEVEWRPALPTLLGGEATVYQGHERVREMFRDFHDVFSEMHVEFSEIRELGDRVVAIGRMRVRGRESGAETESPWAYVAELSNGKGVRIWTYLDPKEALEATGLEESAMSGEKVELVRRANVEALRPVYEEWGRGNWRPRFDLYAPDMEWGWSEEFPLRGVFRDPEASSRRLREWLGQWEDWRCEAEEFIPAGEFVVVLTRYTGRGKESGVAVDTRGAHLWTIRDGKAVRLEVFSSRSKALEAAGLGE